jgi:hypothetical protein
VAAATWGKLASEILTTNWDAAMEEVQKVKESIDTKVGYYLGPTTFRRLAEHIPSYSTILLRNSSTEHG